MKKSNKKISKVEKDAIKGIKEYMKCDTPCKHCKDIGKFYMDLHNMVLDDCIDTVKTAKLGDHFNRAKWREEIADALNARRHNEKINS